MKRELVLSRLSDSVLLSEINMVGTHDSATAFVAYEKTAQCQSLTVREQLNLGVRLLDIRLYRCFGKFRLVHSMADCYTDERKKDFLYFDSIFNSCLAFLRANPRETIVMSIKKDRGLFEKAFFTDFYNSYIRGKEKFWFLENRVPALGECRGKIVLMRRCKKKKNFENASLCGMDFSDWEDQGAKDDTTPRTVVLSGKCRAVVQDRYHFSPEEKWEKCILPVLDNAKPAENTLYLHYLSTCGGNGVPKDCAEYINLKFAEYDMQSDRAQGWLFLDFITEELCDKINNSNLKENVLR